MQAGDGLRVALDDLGNDRVAVDGLDDSAANRDVLGDALRGIKTHGFHARPGNAFDAQLGVGIDGGNQADRHQRGDVDAARLQFGHLRRGFGDEAVDQTIQLGRATPIIRVGRKGQADLGLILDELERPGADRVQVEELLAFFLDICGWHHHRAVARQLGQQHRVGLDQNQINGVVVNDLDRADGGVVGLLRAFRALWPQQTFKAELHRRRIEGLAVVELDALAQGKADALVVVHHLPLGRQTRQQIQLGVAQDQPVEQVAADPPPVEGEGVDRIPAAVIGGKRHGQRALGQRGPDTERQNRQCGRQHDGGPFHACHCFFIPVLWLSEMSCRLPGCALARCALARICIAQL